MVHIDFKDLEGLQAQSEYSAKMGFTGKQVIHPSQIEIVQNSYRYFFMDILQNELNFYA